MAINSIHPNVPGLDSALIPRRQLPRNRRVAAVGDSIASHQSLMTSGYRRFMGYGYLPWANYLGRQRFIHEPEDNYGIPGQTTAEVLARLPAILQVNDAGTIVVDCGTNDIANGLTLADSKRNIQTMRDMIQDAGRVVVLIAQRPRDRTAPGLTLTATQLLLHMQRRDFVLTLHDPAKGVNVINTWEYLADRTSANGAMLAAMHYDGLHPDQTGAYYDGLALAKLFGMGREPGLFPFIDVLTMSASDLYNAASNPRGPLNNNPMMTGNNSGMATGWTDTVSAAGLTNTKSKVEAGGKIWQQSQLSGTATSGTTGYPIYQNPVPAGNLAIGDVVEGYCDFECDAGLTGLHALGLTIVDNTSFLYSAEFDSTTDILARPMPGIAHAGVMKTPSFTLTSTGIRFGICAKPINGQVVAATFRAGAMALRKVA
jgi:lysophospholipase L1-like esterase